MRFDHWFLSIVCLVSFIVLTNATISQNFYQHIQEKYGAQAAQLVARKDFGASGSYGGGSHEAGQKTNRKPVIFIHGMATKASSTLPMAAAFKALGFSESELYATTFGTPGPGGFPLQIAMRCVHIKGVRALIKAVASYTNSKVNVVGYSLGGPVTRKAILGGRCMDTNEDLGPPLTNIVNAYLSVAGAQHGAKTCGGGVGICNLINGIGCGSRFLNDINSKSNYEGSHVYVLQSSSDEIVGYQACGTHPSEIQGAKVVTVSGLGHVQTCATTARIQYNLLTKGSQN